MKSVAELYEYDSDILVHGKQHFSDILYLLVFFILYLQRNDFGKSANQKRNILAEKFLYVAKVGFIRTILNGVVKQCGTDRIGVKSESRHYLGNSQGMGNIWLSALSELSAMQFVCIFICTLDFFKVVILARYAQDVYQPVTVKFGII